MRDLPDHEGSQLVSLLQFVHFYEQVPVLADHRVNLITSEGGQLEYNLKVDLYVLVVDDPGLDDVVVSGVDGRVLRVDAQLGVVDDPLYVVTQREELLLVLLGDDVSSPLLLLVFFTPGLDVVLGHEYVLGLDGHHLLVSIRRVLRFLEGLGSFLLLDLAVRFFLETENGVDRLVLVEDLEVLVYEDDSLLQIVNQLFSALLLIKLLLKFL